MKKYVSIVVVAVLAVLLGMELNTNHVVNAQTSTPTLESEVALSGGTAYGTTGVYARTFTGVTQSIGSDITYTSDSVNGDYLTINSSGLYSASYTDGGGTSATVGVSLNFAATSAWHLAWGTANELCAMTFGNNGSSCSVEVYLSSGDVLRAHSDSLITNPSAIAKFIVVKVR